MSEAEEDRPPPAQTKKKAAKKSRPSSSKTPSASGSESESDEAWGRNKSAYYSSNAAQLDSDDEEANELELQEAKRLQQKVRDAMGDDDFGLGDAVDISLNE